MALAVILLDEEQSPSFDAALLDGLAGTGVTGVTVLRAAQMVAVVLEGWTLEGERMTAATDLFRSGRTGTVFLPVAQVAVAIR